MQIFALKNGARGTNDIVQQEKKEMRALLGLI
jgi:hypothetical protein